MVRGERDHLKPILPQIWKWLNANQASKKSVEKVIDKDKAFCFKPYSYVPRDITMLQLFRELNEEINLVPREVPPKAQTLLATWLSYPTLLQIGVSGKYCG